MQQYAIYKTGPDATCMQLSTRKIEKPDTLRHRLRRETQAAHATLEKRLPIAGASPGICEYQDHLSFLLGFHEPLEETLRTLPDMARLLPDIGDRWKSSALRHDLAGADVGVRAPDDCVPCPRSCWQALGVVYVTEGATLGARSLLPRLRRAGIVPGPVGTRYLDGYGAHSAVMWKRLCQTLDATPEAEATEVVDWAELTFERLNQWRDQWEARQ